ncbi:hypothetical protein LCGC14_3144310 [marine sediment metagenome]|uniref:Uncharacterized protein n=1 Tax=marine sediment metagenome TaxID=412755 RepID=A0A0F8VVX3_9ZZZZ
MKYIVRIFVLPFLLIGYLFYFLYWRAWGIIGNKYDKTEKWENKFLIIIGGILFNSLIYGSISILLIIFTAYLEWVILGMFMSMLGGLISLEASDQGNDVAWLFSEITDLMLDRNPLDKQNSILPSKDPDIEIALKELDEEFPGIQIE